MRLDCCLCTKGWAVILSSNRFILRSKWIFELKVTNLSGMSSGGSEVKVTLTFGHQIPVGIPGRSQSSVAEGKRGSYWDQREIGFIMVQFHDIVSAI